MKQKVSAIKIVLIIWLVFSVSYVGYGEYKRLNNFVAKKAYQRGVSDAINKVIQQAQECKAFPVKIKEKGVKLINLACLQQNGATNETDNKTTK